MKFTITISLVFFFGIGWIQSQITDSENLGFKETYLYENEFEVSKKQKLKSSHYLKQSEKFIQGLDQRYSGKLKKYLQGNFEDMHLEFNKEILEGNLIFNDTLDGFVNGILLELKKQNPTIPDMEFFIAKEGSANAFAMGDNHMIINLGLFYFLESEAEIAAVISHEIGHQMLDHNIESQINTFESQESKSYKSDLAKLRKSKYNTQNKALNLLKNHLYTLSAKSRINELEADSIGYQIYKNSRFPKHEYLNALRTLEKYDTLTPTGVLPETYQRVFDLPEQPFQEKWLKMEDFSEYNYTYKDKIDSDSISSHPESDKRIAKLKDWYPELQNEQTESSQSEAFDQVQKIAYEKRLPHLFHSEEYGGGIYIALLRLQNNPENDHYKDWLGVFFQEIYQARKDYTLNRYLDRIDPQHQSQSYQQFLSFMWNLRLEEIQKIAEFYNPDAQK